MDAKTARALLYTVAGLGAAYLLYKLWQGVSGVTTAVTSTYNTAENAVASGLYSLFGPTLTNYSQFSLVYFPDGSRHAVPTALIGSDGTFSVPLSSDDPQHLQFTAAVEATYGGQSFKVLQRNSDGWLVAMAA